MRLYFRSHELLCIPASGNPQLSLAWQETEVMLSSHCLLHRVWGNGVSAQLWWTLSLRNQVLSLTSSAYASTVAATLIVLLWRDKFLVGNHFSLGSNGMGINLYEALYRETDYFLGVKSRAALNQRGQKTFPNLHLDITYDLTIKSPSK